MSKFHSTVSRRDFMKGLGLAGAGLGATAAAAPVFHDLDEFNSVQSDTKRPWYVKQIDKPKMFEFDSSYVRRDAGLNYQYGISSEQNAELAQIAKDNAIKYWKEGRMEWSYPAQALQAATNSVGTAFASELNTDTPLKGHSTGLFDTLGMTKWQGTAEENAHMVKNAARFFGADLIAITQIDERLYYSKSGGKSIDFRDVSEYEVTDSATIIPKTYRYAIWLGSQWPLPMARFLASPLGNAATRNSIRGFLYAITKPRLAEFIRYLGYNALANAPALDVPVGIAGGGGELSRVNRVVSPEIGPRFYTTTMITDFPMALDKPIDFGIERFCKTCKLCATACPGDAITLDSEPSSGVKGSWSNPGHSAWYEDSKKCGIGRGSIGTGGGCAICFRACPFSGSNDASMHDVVKATVATTGIFNGFFATMHDAFGYGDQMEEDDKVWNSNWRLNGMGVE